MIAVLLVLLNFAYAGDMNSREVVVCKDSLAIVGWGEVHESNLNLQEVTHQGAFSLKVFESQVGAVIRFNEVLGLHGEGSLTTFQVFPKDKIGKPTEVVVKGSLCNDGKVHPKVVKLFN